MILFQIETATLDSSPQLFNEGILMSPASLYVVSAAGGTNSNLFLKPIRG